MKYSTRVFYTETQKAEMWDRWFKGESLNSIGRHFGCGHSSIQRVFARTGGIRPAARQRSRKALTLAIEHGTWVGSRTSENGKLENGGQYTAAWRKTDGVWRIYSELFVGLYCNGVDC